MNSKLFFLLGLSCLSFQMVHAQVEPDKALKKASRELGTYFLDINANAAKLDEAKGNIAIAIADPTISSTAKAWITKGQIYNELCNRDLRNKLMNPNYKETTPDGSFEAYQAFKKALTLSPKGYETKDAIKGLSENMGYLNNYGVATYESQAYDKAFSAFDAMLQVHELLKANSEKSILDKPEDYNNQMYIAALAAMNANKNVEAKLLFEKLYKLNMEKSEIYDALYRLNADADLNAAYQYLEAGRKKFPNDISLLFSEINHFLKTNKLDELTSKLKLAIEKEPNNVSLYTTAGNVYDQLFQKESESGNPTKAKEYFDSAESYYKQALDKDPKNFDANYSLGALFYNKAAAATKVLNSMGDDFTKEGMKKYDAKKSELNQLLDISLPFFKKAEGIDPNDKNTLIAIKEIAARKNDFELVNAMKKRIEVLDAKGKHSEPYFK